MGARRSSVLVIALGVEVINRTARHTPFSLRGVRPQKQKIPAIVVPGCEGELRLQPLDDPNQRKRSFDRET